MDWHFVLLLLLLVGGKTEEEKAEEGIFGANSPSLKELKQRNAECRKQCRAQSDIEFCVVDCIHPECAAKTRLQRVPDNDVANLRFHSDFRKCAQSSFHQDYLRSLSHPTDF